MLAKVFEVYGGLCAGHPLEIIVALFTLTACMINLENGNSSNREGRLSGTSSHCWNGKCSPDVSAIIFKTYYLLFLSTKILFIYFFIYYTGTTKCCGYYCNDNISMCSNPH